MKIFLRSIALFSIAALLVIFPLQASAQSGGYVGLFGGYSFSPDAKYDVSPYSFDLDVQNTWLVGLKIGYTPPQMKFFSIEFEYSYMNPDIDRTVLLQAGGDFIAVEGDATIHSFMVNLIGKYPEGKIHPYFGIGLGFAQFDVSGKFTGRIGGVSRYAEADGDDTPFAWQILAGVEFDINKNFSVDLGYRYYNTKPDLGDDEKIDYKTSVVTLGLKYSF